MVFRVYVYIQSESQLLQSKLNFGDALCCSCIPKSVIVAQFLIPSAQPETVITKQYIIQTEASGPCHSPTML